MLPPLWGATQDEQDDRQDVLSSPLTFGKVNIQNPMESGPTTHFMLFSILYWVSRFCIDSAAVLIMLCTTSSVKVSLVRHFLYLYMNCRSAKMAEPYIKTTLKSSMACLRMGLGPESLRSKAQKSMGPQSSTHFLQSNHNFM